MGEKFRMGKPSEVFVEGEAEKNAHRFIIYFLYDDEDQSVYVEEVEEIDFLKVVQHLSFGGSIFITHRREATSIEEECYEILIQDELISVSGSPTIKDIDQIPNSVK